MTTVPLQQFLRDANSSFLTLPCYILFLTASFETLNIIELGLRPEPHSTEYSCELNYCLLIELEQFHIWQAKMDEISPKFSNFLCLVNSRSI